MPPSVVLEVLKITEAEMDLRDETREVEQIRWALTTSEHSERSEPLAESQKDLRDRVSKVAETIRELPDGPQKFGREIQLMNRVAQVMEDARGLLGRNETGNEAIAAETEAIELLLAARRSNGGGGGGGGNTPGGSNSGGTATAPALALVGRGVAPDARVEDRPVAQAAGAAQPEYPEEFRRGLEHLFNELEKGK